MNYLERSAQEVTEYSMNAVVPLSRWQRGRRYVLGLSVALLLWPGASAQAQEWQKFNAVKQWVGDSPVIAHDLQVDLPLVAEDGSSVNLAVSIPPLADDPVVAMAIFAPGNPTAEVASFELSEALNPVQLATRLRLSESQPVVVAARTASGKAMVSERVVRVTTSGCLAPAGGVAENPEMLARVRLPRQLKAGQSGEILTLISHPMHTGLAKTQKGDTPPLRIIESLQAELEGEPLLKARFYRSLAANPYLRFHITPDQGGELTFTWTETGGRQAEERHELKLS